MKVQVSSNGGKKASRCSAFPFLPMCSLLFCVHLALFSTTRKSVCAFVLFVRQRGIDNLIKWLKCYYMFY